MRSRHHVLVILVVVLLVGVLVLAGCGGQAGSQASSPITIGALFPQTGSLATLGVPSLEGVKMAVDMTNAQGGINGRKIQLVTGDANSPSTAVSETTRLITQDNIKILTGTYASDLSLAASGAAARYDTFYWETDAISDQLTSRGLANFFQFPYSASDNGRTAVRLVKDEVLPHIQSGGALKVAVVHNDSSYAALVAQGAVTEAGAQGFQVVANISYPTQTTDMTPVALQLKSLTPDVVVAASYADDATLLQRALRQQNIQLKAFIGTGGIYGLNSFGSALGSAATGIFDTEGSPDIPDSVLSSQAQHLRSQFQTQWQTKYHNKPGFLPSIGFDATWVLLHDVIGKAKSLSPSDLKAAAHALDMPLGSTILGYGVKFSSAGLNERSFVVGKQWQNGQLPVVYPSNLASTQPIDVPLPPWSQR